MNIFNSHCEMKSNAEAAAAASKRNLQNYLIEIEKQQQCEQSKPAVMIHTHTQNII